MSITFINLSHHPSRKWGERQYSMASEYGKIVDIRFPEIDPHGSSEYIDRLVDEYFDKVMEYEDPVVMVQGEFLFTYRLIVKLKKAGIKVLAGCSEHRTIEYIDDNGFTVRRSEFEFVNFKEY